jgi:prepilin-type N-terminal cleavage/methylation domain-containing protein
MRKIRNKGMTLVEVLIAAMVLSMAAGAILSSMNAVLEIIDAARDRTQATSDLRTMLERVKATPFDNLIARFPNGTVDNSGNDTYSGIVGSYVLTNQHIVVTYPDPNAEPLEVSVVLSWQDKRGRSKNASMHTYRAR